MRRGVVIKTVINGMPFDGSTTDPMQQALGDALVAFMAATAQAQTEATKSAQRAGIDHSRTVKPSTYLGRKPSYDRPTFDRLPNASAAASALQPPQPFEARWRGWPDLEAKAMQNAMQAHLDIMKFYLHQLACGDSARVSCAAIDLQCTGRNQPSRISWAIPRASLRSVFTCIVLSALRTCRVSSSSTASPA